jgi:hypothetical protein
VTHAVRSKKAVAAHMTTLDIDQAKRKVCLEGLGVRTGALD